MHNNEIFIRVHAFSKPHVFDSNSTSHLYWKAMSTHQDKDLHTYGLVLKQLYKHYFVNLSKKHRAYIYNFRILSLIWT